MTATKNTFEIITGFSMVSYYMVLNVFMEMYFCLIILTQLHIAVKVWPIYLFNFFPK